MVTTTRIAGFFLAPIALGAISALAMVVGYRYFGVQVQLEPLSLELLELACTLCAGIVAAAFAIPLLSDSKFKAALVAFPLFAFAAIKCLSFQGELVAFLGYGCCRESPPGILRLLEMALSPAAPYLMAT